MSEMGIGWGHITQKAAEKDNEAENTGLQGQGGQEDGVEVMFKE